MKQRIVIIGLDGATFDLLTPWMDEGLLPCLALFREHAVTGVLNSTIPPTTPPAWTTCFTGLNPGRHGIFDFTESPLKDPSRPLVSSKDAIGVRLWQIIAEYGGRSILVNVPMTYPPEPIHGDLISGMLAPDFDSRFTFPDALKIEIKAVCGNYIPNLDVPKYDPGDRSSLYRFFEDLRESTERRIEAIRHLMDTRDWSFLFAVFIGMDRIQHLMFKYLGNQTGTTQSPDISALRHRAIDEYQRIDRSVGEIIEKAGDDAVVFIVSDHGFGATDAYFNTNTWLKDLGYLRVHPMPYLRKRLFHLALRIDESDLWKHLIPRSISSFIRERIRAKRSTAHSARTDLDRVIDWDRTQAYFASIPTQGIYINETAPGMTPARVETLKSEIRSQLDSLKEPGSDRKLADNVWFREEIFEGSEMHRAPHIVFRMKNYAVLGRQHLGTGSWFSSCVHLPIGFHRPEGILMAKAPGMTEGAISNAAIRDVLPTVLYAGGVPVPDDLDGRILTGMFDRQHLLNNPVQYCDYSKLKREGSENPDSPFSDSERQTINERLKNLGYLE